MTAPRKPGAVYTPGSAARAICRTALRLFLRDKSAEALHSLRVFDPAAGTGQLLLAMLEELAALGVDRRQAVHNLYGMDIDPEAVRICSERLGGGHIECGDTLFAAVPGPFDVIVANPPYIDSETMTRHHGKSYRRKIAGQYSCARGNWDLYIPFFERGLELLKPDGCLVYITPDKWLSKSFGASLRTRCLPKLLSLETVGQGVFDDVRVDAVITAMSARNSDTLQANSQTVRKTDLTAPYALDYLFSPRLPFIRQMESFPARLADFGHCEPSCATADAYKLLPLLRKGGDGYRLVNTGTIAPFSSRWGEKPITYLKHKFRNPTCSREEFLRIFPRAYGRKTRLPKIIIKGLNRLDAMSDFDAGYIPGKTTLIFHSPNPDHLLFALGIINSSPARQYVNERYRASSYNGAVSFTPAMIESIPVPADREFYENVVEKVRQILAAPSAPALRQELDEWIRQAYGNLSGASGIQPV